MNRTSMVSRAALTVIGLVAGVWMSVCYAQKHDEYPAQYHIQTDQGPERFFRFQTLSGQYRKEVLHADGSVRGTYGWVDPNGILRLFDYISDAGGYRIEQQRLFKVPADSKDVSCQDNVELCFELYSLDLDSETSLIPGSQTGGPKIHAASLQSNSQASNPISKQAEATFFDITARDVPAAPPPPPRIVIGEASPRQLAPPSSDLRRPFVIGHTASGSTVTSARRATPDPVRRSGIVIGSTK